jgi:hypothetical protein
MADLPFFREQASLAVAVQRLGLPWSTFGEEANWPAHLRPLNGAAPALVHYHRPDVIAATPLLRAAVQRLAARRAPVRRVLASRPAWAPLLD